MAIIYTDGHIDGLNGVGGEFADSGYSLVKTDIETFTIPYKKRRLTNNEAELMAIFHAITKAMRGDIIYSDSKIAINIATKGQALAKDMRERVDLLATAIKYIIDRKQLILKWISRERNPVT